MSRTLLDALRDLLFQSSLVKSRKVQVPSCKTPTLESGLELPSDAVTALPGSTEFLAMDYDGMPGLVIDEAPPAYSPFPLEQAGGPISRPRFVHRLPGLREGDDQFPITSETVFIMDAFTNQASICWDKVRAALHALVPITTSHERDGINLESLRCRTPAHSSTNSTRNQDSSFASNPRISTLTSVLRPHRDGLLRARVASSPQPTHLIIISEAILADGLEGIAVTFAKKRRATPWYQLERQVFQAHEISAVEGALSTSVGERDGPGVCTVNTMMWNGSEEVQGSLTADDIIRFVLGAVMRRLERRLSPTRSQ